MFDLFLILVCLLLALTLGTSIIFYRRLREVKERYVEAKEIVGDIVVSFNRQLNRQGEVLDSTNRRAETAYLKSERVERKIGDLEKVLESLAVELKSFHSFRDEVNKKLKSLVESQRKIEKKIVGLEKLEYQLSVESEEFESEGSVPSVPIPIRRDKVLSSLTETELTVLEILANEGPKTAPQIKDRIKLTREHTARLMKKLYEQGYLERDTTKIPYSYRIKEEMLRLLRKKESSE
jgi:hypothetical protein